MLYLLLMLNHQALFLVPSLSADQLLELFDLVSQELMVLLSPFDHVFKLEKHHHLLVNLTEHLRHL